MKDKPIIFSTEMVKAILEGRKIQTRRVAKNPKKEVEQHGFGLRVKTVYKKPYQKDQILWVREKFRYSTGDYSPTLEEELSKTPKVIYYANDHSKYRDQDKWKPSIYMPRKVARIFLKVLNVRIERLQDITEENAIKEGCLLAKGYEELAKTMFRNPYREVFQDLWDSINKKRGYGWDVNPYVWVIGFEMIRKNK